jgi:2'-5' RNA ligase
MTVNETQWRLFVAVELPQTWLDTFARLIGDARGALAQDATVHGVRVRWVRPEGIHLTLKFLGETPESRVDSVLRAMEQAVATPPGIELKAGRLGSFSDRRAPHIVWAGIEGEVPALQALAARIDVWLGAAGFPKEQKGLLPHLTLARLPEKLSPEQRLRVAEITGRFQPQSLPSYRVDHVSLIRSYLGQGGARYERVASFPPLHPS